VRSVTRDFITLFNKFWYRDFPLAETHKDTGSRAEWTTHIGICVRACADLMGYFTHFEQGNRTDAVIRDNTGRDIAHIEWEWTNAFRDDVNEIRKLRDARDSAKFSAFISYSKDEYHEKNLATIRRQWGHGGYPLVVILATYEYRSKARWLRELQTYHLQRGLLRLVRAQPANPWQVEGSRWQSLRAQ
jgi:hypothetical protein